MLVLNQVGVQGRLSPITVETTQSGQIHLLGPNGAGKSTLLIRIAGLLSGQGTVYLDGQDFSHYSLMQQARLRAYLCQQQSCHNGIAVFQYLTLYQPTGVQAEVLQDTVDYLCNKLSLLDKLTQNITMLSGGEWQRVRLAAIFLQVWPVINPDSRLLLLDEPMNSLDIGQQVALRELIAQFVASGRLVLLSSHDINQTLHHADEVWLMERGELKLAGPTKEIVTPYNLSKLFKVEFSLMSAGSRDWLVAEELK